MVIDPAGLGRVVARVARGVVHEMRAGDRLQVGAVTLEAVHEEAGCDSAAGVSPLRRRHYGPRAAEAMQRLARFLTTGNLILLGAVDRVTEEVTGFEDLDGSHGGPGDRQPEPFILCPASPRLAENPPVGAPAL